MIYVGVAGYKRCGKDTFTKMLIDELIQNGLIAKRRSFADALKEECADMMVRELRKTARKYKGKYDFKIPTKKEFLKRMHSDEYKELYRLLMQWWGTEFKRKHVIDTYWIDMVEEWANASGADVVLVADVRFVNEVNFVKKNGGISIWVYRDGCNPSEHASENDLDNYSKWHYTVENNATYDDLKSIAQQVGLEITNAYNTKEV